MILDYVVKFHIQDFMYILSEKDNLAHYNVKIDFLKLFETYPHVGDKVLCNPIECLPVCDEELVKAQQNILQQDEYKTKIAVLEYCHVKRNVYARFFGLPVCPELHRTIFPKNVDLACFLKVTGTVVRVTQSKMLEYQRKYVCIKCRYENLMKADFEARYILKAPNKCGNVDPKCRCSTFTQLNLVSREYCKDYQEIKIQEQVNKLNIGTIPGSMWVVLEDDLVDCCKPGDDVNICGTVRRRWRPTSQNKKAEVELVLQANFVEVCNAQRSQVISAAPDVKDCFNKFWNKFEACPLKGRDQILSSVCSQVYGLHLVKLALLLTIITGSNHVVEEETEKKSSTEDKHTNRIRGQCHLLLVGDPGTGKSQLLRAGVELTPRSVFTSGAGSTRAGLTCSALREDGEWQLEAGALVLSDGGVCCIDEISQLRDHDRAAIHEAMEQQTISIAKAGIVCKLNTRCAVVAACNPKGHYQTDQPLSVNVSLGTPLLSRFDLIFILLDSKNKTWDQLVSSYILFGETNPADRKKQWSLEKLQMYIGLVGPKQVEMTKSANMILQSYYMLQRKSEYRDPSRTTVRMLDSLFRLSQAHCRLMFRTTILPVDAITAVSLVDLSMQDCTLRDTLDALHSTFHKYPDFDYLCTAKKLLTKLNLYEIWQEELLFYGKLLQVDHKTLENEINNNSYKLFAKYDDVADDNIPLSSTLVTSSFFNNKKPENENNNLKKGNNKNNDNGTFKERNKVNDKLAATLHKHSRLNIKQQKLPIKNSTKRKRKEVTVDFSSVRDASRKTVKKLKIEVDDDSAYISDSDENFKDTKNILNVIPSVNDVFNDLGINFNIDNTCDNNSPFKNKMKFNDKSSITPIVQGERSKKCINMDVDSKKLCTETNDHKYTTDTVERDNKSLERNCSKIMEKQKPFTVNKLKQFQFVENHDLSKFYDENIVKNKSVKNTEQSLVKEEKNESTKCLNTSVINKKPSVSNSQISLFESSDCEIDLDI